MVKKVFVAASEDDEEPTLIKKPYQKLKFKSAWEQSEFFRCALDPVYFINKYVYVSHPTKGRVPFKLYDYQINMVRAYQNNRQVVAMCSRQLGKSVTAETFLNRNGKEIKIEKLVKLSFREKVVNILEKILINLTKS